MLKTDNTSANDEASSPSSPWIALRDASGFLVIFVPPALLVLGPWIGVPALAFLVVFGLFPFARLLFGDTRSGQITWPEPIAAALHALPLWYLPVSVVAAGAGLFVLFQSSVGSPEPDWWVLTQYGLSLWIVNVLGLPPAHELGHRTRGLSRWAAPVLTGVIGYPLLTMEHAAHHASRATTDKPEWPALNESAWAFALRRARWVFHSALEFDRSVRLRNTVGGLRSPLRVAVAAWIATAAAYGAFAGGVGLLLFLAVSAGVLFAMQLMTYVQHWSLAPSDLPSQLQTHAHAWEDTCAFQRWLTLGIAFHEAHHRQPGRPYFLLQAVAGSPRAPTGYVGLLVLCLVPPLWRRWMGAARAAWLQAPMDAIEPGHRVWCFTMPDAGVRSRP